jgi:hypothetical protein
MIIGGFPRPYSIQNRENLKEKKRRGMATFAVLTLLGGAGLASFLKSFTP